MVAAALACSALSQPAKRSGATSAMLRLICRSAWSRRYRCWRLSNSEIPQAIERALTVGYGSWGRLTLLILAGATTMGFAIWVHSCCRCPVALVTFALAVPIEGMLTLPKLCCSTDASLDSLLAACAVRQTGSACFARPACCATWPVIAAVGMKTAGRHPP